MLLGLREQALSFQRARIELFGKPKRIHRLLVCSVTNLRVASYILKVLFTFINFRRIVRPANQGLGESHEIGIELEMILDPGRGRRFGVGCSKCCCAGTDRLRRSASCHSVSATISARSSHRT